MPNSCQLDLHRSHIKQLVKNMKLIFKGLISLLALALSSFAFGQQTPTFPSKPFKLIVPFPAGSGTDQSARRLATDLATKSGQSVVVENKPGASGFIAAQAVANANPDGYTLFVTTNTTHGANSALFRKLPYDPVKDFDPISTLAYSDLVLIVSPQSPYKDAKALIGAMRAKGTQFKFGAGNSSGRLASEMLRLQTGADAIAIPYRGTPQAMTDLMGNLFDFMFVDLGAALPLIQNGKLRALATSGNDRALLLRDIPTIQESGIRDFQLGAWSAVFAPAGTPKAVVAKLSEWVRTIMNDPEMRQTVSQTGGRAKGSTPEELRLFVASEIKKWGIAIKAAGIEPE
jgi:tripartite-type tricarboxylate transporter receptor subunit TctC